MPTDPNDPINTLMPNTGQTAPPAGKSADDNDDNIAGFNSTPSESNVWPGKPPFGEPSFSDESLTKKVENVQAETPGTYPIIYWTSFETFRGEASRASVIVSSVKKSKFNFPE
ncbi:MAG: hypothetical protein UU77_C0031G0001, partial [candidate division WWE3 bacterium GW2011_GWC1_41_7]